MREREGREGEERCMYVYIYSSDMDIYKYSWPQATCEIEREGGDRERGEREGEKMEHRREQGR